MNPNPIEFHPFHSGAYIALQVFQFSHVEVGEEKLLTLIITFGKKRNKKWNCQIYSLPARTIYNPH